MIFKNENKENKNILIFKSFVSKIIEIFIISFLIFLLWNNMLTIDRLIRYLIIILIILIYLFIVYIIKLILIENWWNQKKNIYKKEKNIIEKEKMINEISNIFNKLLILYKWMNPMLGLFLYFFENQLYYFRWFNYKFKNFLILKYLNYYFIKLIYILIINPVLLIFWFYYKIIKRWKEYSLTELLFRRTEGLILSVLIFTDFYKVIYNYILEYNIYIIFYFILIFLNQFIIFYNKILFKKFKKYYEYFFINYSIHAIFGGSRNKSTILGILLQDILNTLKYEDTIKLNFIGYFSYYYSYIDLNNFIKEKLLNFSLDKILLKEEKYKPSYYYYNGLIKCYSESFIGLDDINEIWIIIKNCKKEEDLKLYKEYYNYKINCLKIIFFLIWSIEDYLKIENIYLKWWEYHDRVSTGGFNLEEKNKDIYINNIKEYKFLDISEDKKILYSLLQKCSMKTEKEYNYQKILNNLEKVDDDYSKEVLEEYRKEYEEWYKNIRKEWDELKKIKGINQLIIDLYNKKDD